MRERKYRVMGSTCYAAYTYIWNKNPDWEKKCCDFKSPKNFKTKATDFGNQYKSQAREIFRHKYQQFQIIETGLVVSQVNPWLAYSPDDVILKDGKLISVLEIKCFLDGKINSIDIVIKSQIEKCLDKIDNQIVLKQKS